MNTGQIKKKELLAYSKIWLVTGVVGFIGFNFLEALLKLNQWVVGLVNFETGFRKNPKQVHELVSAEQWSRFSFIEDDIRNLDACKEATNEADYVSHEATPDSGDVVHQTFNVALGDRTTLNELFMLIREQIAKTRPAVSDDCSEYCAFQEGDVRHSQADIVKIQEHLGYASMYRVIDDIRETTAFYMANAGV